MAVLFFLQLFLQRAVVTVAELTVWGAQPQHTRQLLCLERVDIQEKSRPMVSTNIKVRWEVGEQDQNSVRRNQGGLGVCTGLDKQKIEKVIFWIVRYARPVSFVDLK